MLALVSNMLQGMTQDEDLFWNVLIATLITIQLGVDGFLCVTQIGQGNKIVRLDTKVDVLMGEREASNANRKAGT